MVAAQLAHSTPKQEHDRKAAVSPRFLLRASQAAEFATTQLLWSLLHPAPTPRAVGATGISQLSRLPRQSLGGWGSRCSTATKAACLSAYCLELAPCGSSCSTWVAKTACSTRGEKHRWHRESCFRSFGADFQGAARVSRERKLSERRQHLSARVVRRLRWWELLRATVLFLNTDTQIRLHFDVSS